METTIPTVNNAHNKTLSEVVAEIITDTHLYYVDDIPQLDVSHVAMLHTQERILDYIQHNWSLDKDEMYELSCRCKQVSKYLDLISDVSRPNRYVKLPDASEEQN